MNFELLKFSDRNKLFFSCELKSKHFDKIREEIIFVFKDQQMRTQITNFLAKRSCQNYQQ